MDTSIRNRDDSDAVERARHRAGLMPLTVCRQNVESLHLGQTLYHKTMTNADGSPVRCRINGRVKLWKRKPHHFSIPAKHGLRFYFYIDPTNADIWYLQEEDVGL